MIVLDILSELMRSAPHPSVVTWIDAQAADELALTSITMAELLYGIGRLPDGKRKSALKQQALAMFEVDFPDRILPFDGFAAEYYAELVVRREQAGRPISMAEAQIAAICQGYGASLVTRNLKDFEGLDLMLINPWDN